MRQAQRAIADFDFASAESALVQARALAPESSSLRAAELQGVDRSECCVIEDSRAGVDAARAAGMNVIAITNSLSADKLALATRVVSNYSEIEALLL